MQKQPFALYALIAALLIGILFFAVWVRSLDRDLDQVGDAMTDLTERLDAAESRARAADARAVEAERQAEVERERAFVAEKEALAAEDARLVAESEKEVARYLAEEARGREARALARATSAYAAATAARDEAAEAREEAEELREEREAELQRLETALGELAETRRTALGLVMNLGDSIEFDFDAATLRQENRELLARIAGVLMTADDYAIQVFGHTDDQGDEQYNQRLSEDRAQAVLEYLVESGVKPGIISSQGLGKTQPLVAGTDEKARQRNRRVEIAVISYDASFEQIDPDG